MGTLYVSTLPSGSLEDWPLRAQTRLPEVSLVVAANVCAAQTALRGVSLAAPLVGLPDAGALLGALETGDVMLLLDGAFGAPPGCVAALIRAAVDQGFPVESMPGPALPVTALVSAGLPTESFVYLGRLPAEPAARHDLLASVAAERRTLVLVTDGEEAGLWDALHDALGARPAVLWAGTGAASGAVWRGALGSSGTPPVLPDGPCAVVIARAEERPALWIRERLEAEMRICLDQGMSPGQAAKQLAAPSGWPRREIYRLAVRANSACEEESTDDRIR